MNGQRNRAQPIAIGALLTLCISLSYFWYRTARDIGLSLRSQRRMQTSGILSMGVAVLLFTRLNHDVIIHVASGFGMIAVVILWIRLYQQKKYVLFSVGILNLIWIAINNVLYYHSDWIYYLPLVQKMTFACFLMWFCAISIQLYLNQKWGATAKMD